jgi:hypothetical protein
VTLTRPAPTTATLTRPAPTTATLTRPAPTTVTLTRPAPTTVTLTRPAPTTLQAPALDPEGPGQVYCRLISKLAESDPPAFICHYYNFYFAHTAGGRMIGKKVGQSVCVCAAVQQCAHACHGHTVIL